MCINVLHVQLTSWLRWSSIGVEIKVGHRLFDAHTESHALQGKRMDGIHKLSIFGWESVSMRHSLKHRTRRIQTYNNKTNVYYFITEQELYSVYLWCLKSFIGDKDITVESLYVNENNFKYNAALNYIYKLNILIIHINVFFLLH